MPYAECCVPSQSSTQKEASRVLSCMLDFNSSNGSIDILCNFTILCNESHQTLLKVPL